LTYNFPLPGRLSDPRQKSSRR